MGPVTAGSNARGSESEEQRGGAVNCHESNRDELCRIPFCEPGKSQGEGQGTVLSVSARATDLGGSESRGIEVVKECRITGWRLESAAVHKGSGGRNYLPLER
jgi:hypothetical protein